MDPPNAPPPSYGAVVPEGSQAPNAPPPAGPGEDGQPPYPVHNSAFPQPGQGSAYSTQYAEPPPKYEPPKNGQQYPPPPPPGAYQPGPYTNQPQGYQGATVYPGQTTVHQTVLVTQPGYGPTPKTTECPNCHAMVTTSLSYQSGGLTWLSAGLMCLFGCWMGCCLIPFCIDDLQDVEHRCPNCGKHIGTFTRL